MRSLAVLAAALAITAPASIASAAAQVRYPANAGTVGFGGIEDTVVGPDSNLWGIYYAGGGDGGSWVVGKQTDTRPSALWKGNSTPAHGADAVGVGFDKAGSMYISTCPSGNSAKTRKGLASIEVHARGTSSTAPAARTIAGARTGLRLSGGTCTNSESMAVGADGTVYVLTSDGAIRVFAAGANGDVAPRRVISGARTGLKGAQTLRVGTDGSLYAGSDSALRVFAPWARGDIAPSRVLTGEPGAIATWSDFEVDNFGNLYTATSGGLLAVFAPGAAGAAKPLSVSDLLAKQSWWTDSPYRPLEVGGELAGIDRNRRLRLQTGPTIGRIWLKYNAVVAKASASMTVTAFSAPTASTTGSASAAVSATAKGGTLSGNVRFVLTAKGCPAQMITVPLSGGGGAPSTGTAKAVLPKLARGSWTLQIAYGGNGDFAPVSAYRTIAVG